MPYTALVCPSRELHAGARSAQPSFRIAVHRADDNLAVGMPVNSWPRGHAVCHSAASDRPCERRPGPSIARQGACSNTGPPASSPVLSSWVRASGGKGLERCLEVRTETVMNTIRSTTRQVYPNYRLVGAVRCAFPLPALARDPQVQAARCSQQYFGVLRIHVNSMVRALPALPERAPMECAVQFALPWAVSCSRLLQMKLRLWTCLRLWVPSISLGPPGSRAEQSGSPKQACRTVGEAGKGIPLLQMGCGRRLLKTKGRPFRRDELAFSRSEPIRQFNKPTGEATKHLSQPPCSACAYTQPTDSVHRHPRVSRGGRRIISREDNQSLLASKKTVDSRLTFRRVKY